MSEVNVPKLRFREFEGEWVEKRLGEIAKITMGQSPSSSSYNDKNIGIPLIQGNADCKNRKTLPRIFTTESTKECNVNDIIMTVRAPVGAVSKSYHNACIGRGVCAITSKEKNDFIYQFLIKYEDKWNKYAQGSTFTAVNSKDVINLKLNLPQKTEQQKIANFLTSIDQKIEQLTKKEKLLVAYKKGVMQKIFSRQIRFRDENGEVYGDWVEKRLGDLCRIAKSGGTPTSTNKSYYAGDIPFLAISDMTSQGKYLTYTSKSISQKGLDNSSSWLVPVNTIIYSMYASVGFVAINKIPLATSQAVINLILNDNINTEYIYYYLSYLKKTIHKFIETGTQGNLNAQSVKSLRIQLPTESEQTKIANFLSSIDKKIEQVNRQIEESKGFKKGLLQQMFV